MRRGAGDAGARCLPPAEPGLDPRVVPARLRQRRGAGARDNAGVLFPSIAAPYGWPPPGAPSARLQRCLLLALLLHGLLIALVGNVPGGTAALGQGVFGAINVTLRGSGEAGPPERPAAPAPDAGPAGGAPSPRHGGAVRDSRRPAPPDDAPGAARLGAWAPGAPPRAELPERAVPVQPALRPLPDLPPAADAPQPAPPPSPVPVQAQGRPPALTPTLSSPPTLRRQPDSQRAPLAPPALQPPAAPADLLQGLPAPPPLAALEGRLGAGPAAAPANAAPRRVEAISPPQAVAPQPPRPGEALPVLPDLAAAVPAPPRRLQPLAPAAAVPEAPLAAPAAAPPPELPLPALPALADAASPRLGVAPALRGTAAPAPALPPAPPATAPVAGALPELPALPSPGSQVQAPPAAAAAKPAGPAPAAALPDAAAGPADARTVPAAPPGAVMPGGVRGAPDAGATVGRDVATAPSVPASAPRLNLTLPRTRGGELSRQGTPGVLPLLPRPPDKPDALAREIEKAGRKDCREAYAGMGLLAVVPLALDAARREGSCKW